LISRSRLPPPRRLPPDPDARREGFSRTELGATMGGEPLYRACGYPEIERMDVPTPGGVTVPITRMGKQL
jgi:hypothetical protein